MAMIVPLSRASMAGEKGARDEKSANRGGHHATASWDSFPSVNSHWPASALFR